MPTQMHTMMEIINAMTVPTSAASMKRWDHDAAAAAAAAPEERPPREVRFTTDIVEGMLRESMHAALKPGLGGRTGWAGQQEMEDSAEFHSMVGAQSGQGGGGGGAGARAQRQQAATEVPPVPKIKVRLFYAIVALLEKDDFIAKLGGEATKAMALESMRSSAFNFFNGKFTFSTKDRNQVETFHSQVWRYGTF